MKPGLEIFAHRCADACAPGTLPGGGSMVSLETSLTSGRVPFGDRREARSVREAQENV